MNGKEKFIPVSQLCRYSADVLVRCGVPRKDAELCADVILASDLRGIESHGVSRLKFYCDHIRSGQFNPVSKPEVVRQTATTAVVDGQHGMGMVIAAYAMLMAIEKAGQFGMGCVAVRNSTHFGIAGYYPLLAVQKGMIGIAVTNTRPSVAPTFSVQPMLGTNPIAFGAPTDEPFPFLFDAATPIIQRGKVEVYARRKKSIPDGWIIDRKNMYMHDPLEILAQLNRDTAALVPLGGAGESLGGHKGYGLGTIVEILSASLQQGAFLQGLTGISEDGSTRPFRIGHFFMAIDVEGFVSLAEFKACTGRILRDLRSARKAPGVSRIFTAGEKEYEMELRRKKEGIPLDPRLLDELISLQKDLDLRGEYF